jgi:hypothetical protein
VVPIADDEGEREWEHLSLPRIIAAGQLEEHEMRALILSTLAITTLLGGCESSEYDRPTYGYSQYDYDRPDPAYGGYDASRYYRDDPQYQERGLSQDERVYRGNDGRYYCRRSDGTTGLIVGALAGGVLGNIIAPGGSKTLGTIIGAGGGAIAGSAIDQSSARCR